MKRLRTRDEDEPVVYLTRARDGVSWDMWNADARLLDVRKGQVLRGRALAADMSGLIPVRVVAATDFSLQGERSAPCSPGDHIVLDSYPHAASTEELTALVSAQGVAPAAYLGRGFAEPEDLELSLGRRTCELHVAAVDEMMRRGYDIMHHYPLFSRALTMYYEDTGVGDLPGEDEMMEPGGLLDRSAEQHCRLHGVQLVGDDRHLYSKWNYSCRTAPRVDEAAGEVAGAREATEDAVTAADFDTADSGSTREDEPAEDSCSDSDSDSDEPGPALDPTVLRMAEFNSVPSVLTDSQPGPLYTVRRADGVDFDYLVSYCTRGNVPGLGGLPDRSSWGSVNPVLLMDDSFNRDLGKSTYRYAVTSRGTLSHLGPDDVLCYNEVFLPGRPVSRLNLDIDLKCCSTHHLKLSVKGGTETKLSVCKLMAASLVSAIIDTLSSMGSSAQRPLEPADVGKVAAYARVSSKSKLSLRMLWYLPVELCSFGGIDAYRGLIVTLGRQALGYALLSKPTGSDLCGLCDIARAMSVMSHAKCLRVSLLKEPRESAVDVGPYATRKSVRLPNCHKSDAQGTAAFEYVATFNSSFPDPGSERPDAASVGLSSSPILPDVTSLGPGFETVVCGGEPALIRLPAEALGNKRVYEALVSLEELWGVHATVVTSGSGLTIVQAMDKSNYPCPIHGTVHESFRLRAVVLADSVKYKCFVNKQCR